jgi:hypothetical protein
MACAHRYVEVVRSFIHQRSVNSQVNPVDGVHGGVVRVIGNTMALFCC